MNGLFRSVVLTVCVIGLAACAGKSPDDDSSSCSDCFELVSLEYAPTVYGSYPFELSFTIENEGSTVLTGYEVDVVFRSVHDESEEYVIATDIDSSSWTSGSHDAYFNEAITTVPDGTYDVFLHVHDSSNSLQLANVWDSTSGYNELGNTVEVKASPLTFADADVVLVESFDENNGWSYGNIDTELYLEGIGSLRWDIDEGSDTLITRYSLPSAIDTSEGEYFSFWVHNTVPADYVVDTVNNYGQVVQERVQIVLNSAYTYGYLTLDFSGWKQVTVHGNLDSVSSIEFRILLTETDSVTSRTLHFDGFASSLTPLSQPHARFLSTFEEGSFTADIGTGVVYQNNKINYVDTPATFVHVVDNPDPSSENPSDMVFKINTTEGYTRAEYATGGMETPEKTYIYAWKEYFPYDYFAPNFFEGIDVFFIFFGQFWGGLCDALLDETTKCGYGGGVWDDRRLQGYDGDDGAYLDFFYRAEPNCDNVYYTPPAGVWVSNVHEVYWTNSEAGYYNFYMNGELVGGGSGKTLLDGFAENSKCQLDWHWGTYNTWSKTGDATMETLEYYLDDMAVFDEDDGVTVEDVMEWQETGVFPE